MDDRTSDPHQMKFLSSPLARFPQSILPQSELRSISLCYRKLNTQRTLIIYCSASLKQFQY
ncbi:uncharacterized protein UBRO_20414 [Ustilago bromivora]|uniref:Uncharacterized protein n=1 Tax=Ustilago bromivora TaxID=307758 RepID=A0A1K0FVI5_9BASI|nr:uncharacterized protein UBRO_20414 [Ustilago bromivora]